MNSWANFQQRFKKLEFDLKRENRDAKLDDPSNKRPSLEPSDATSSSSTPSRTPKPGFFKNVGRFSLGKGSIGSRGLNARNNSATGGAESNSPSHLNNNPLLANASNSPPNNLFSHNPTVNAQCLSPRPRPKALPIGINAGFGNDPSPSRRPQFPGMTIPPIPTMPPREKLGDRFQNNNTITFDRIEYQCKDDDFEYIDELGAGSCGQVSKERHKLTNRLCAVKHMRRSGNDDETKRIAMDLGVLLKCSECKDIVQCYGYVIKEAEVSIFMELMGSCFEKLLKKINGPIPEPILGKIAVATVRALHYLKEEHKVMHRDIKPSNILINSEGQVKLCDFGISGHLVDSKAKSRAAGCAAYLAPERIEPPSAQFLYDVRADVWSLGITLVELAQGSFPYKECKTDFEVLSRVIQDDSPTLPDDGTFSPEFRDFINDCLEKDYRKRPKYKKLLEHPFIKLYEVKSVNVSSWYASVTLSTSPPPLPARNPVRPN
ncbi:Dual specificity mitogen-activated protein kinase kinase 7 [Halotydeus destructor]|nr:Dual specificity mitogen-activated protein kinase kinase 7 [Halotydeus destructor]